MCELNYACVSGIGKTSNENWVYLITNYKVQINISKYNRKWGFTLTVIKQIPHRSNFITLILVGFFTSCGAGNLQVGEADEGVPWVTA